MTQMDSQIMIGDESTYKTPVTPDVAFEFNELNAAWEPQFGQGEGLRYGRIMDRVDRRTFQAEQSSVSFSIEPKSKGLLTLLEAALGTVTSTNITGSAYQHLFVPKTSDYLKSYTIQTGTPLIGGATSPVTYAGAMCQGFELTQSNKDDLKMSFDWIAAALSTATSLATASYPTSDVPFTFPHFSCTVGGSVTVPTTTALASGGTSVSNVREASFSWSNGLDTEGYNAGSTGQRSRRQLLGKRVGTGTLTAEFDSTTYRDAFLNQTSLPLTFTWALPTAITGSHYPTLQIVLPCVRLEGELAKPTDDGSPITQSLDFTVLDGGVEASPVYIVVKSVETAVP